jgi:geranylgeranyl diphosphate synthase type II
MQLLNNYRQSIEKTIINHFSSMEASLAGVKTPLQEACEYALLNGGKRFRPSLLLMVAKALNKGWEPLQAAFAIECFHTASLIADDLPCMDNDDFRREKPATHKVFGEATALLASYALISEGYKALALCPAPSLSVYPLAIENVSNNTGLLGASGGQYWDICPKDLSLDEAFKIIHMKTGTLFEISFVLGWLYGGGDAKLLHLVKQAAYHFGIAFQIADDFGDQEQDRKNGRLINIANLIGTQKAEEMFHVELNSFLLRIKDLGLEESDLVHLSSSLLRRSSV